MICRGRQYPNAPLTHFTGAVGRIAPHFLILEWHSLTGEAAVWNGDQLAECIQFTPMLKALNPQVAWAGGGSGIWPEFQFTVRVFHFSGWPWINVTIHTDRTAIGGGFQRREYETAFTDGIPWSTLPRLRVGFHLEGPVWTWGGPGDMRIRCGIYSQLPAGTCVGV